MGAGMIVVAFLFFEIEATTSNFFKVALVF